MECYTREEVQEFAMSELNSNFDLTEEQTQRIINDECISDVIPDFDGISMLHLGMEMEIHFSINMCVDSLVTGMQSQNDKLSLIVDRGYEAVK